MNWADKIPGAPDFKWGEFFVTAEHNEALLRQEFLALSTATQSAIQANILQLAHKLQVVRDIYGKKLSISSGWRSKRVNSAVGGAPESCHLKGMAADFNIAGVTPSKVQKDFTNWHGGMEFVKDWTHLDIGPKRRFYPNA